jgi:hypothetical protein
MTSKEMQKVYDDFAKFEAIPNEVLAALMGREHSAQAILRMTPKELFIEYCEWHGLINWGNTLWDIVIALSKIEEKEDKRLLHVKK